MDDEGGDAGLSLLLELDAVVSTIVAAERIGRLPRGSAAALATQLGHALVGATDRALQLAQLAEDRWLTTGHDEDLPGAYAWLDVLAEPSPSRTRVTSVIRTAAARQRRVDDALVLLEDSVRRVLH